MIPCPLTTVFFWNQHRQTELKGATWLDGTATNRIGRLYNKIVYREYTNATFSTPVPRAPEWEHLGIVGPVLRGQVWRVVVCAHCRVFFFSSFFPGSGRHLPPFGSFFSLFPFSRSLLPRTHPPSPIPFPCSYPLPPFYTHHAPAAPQVGDKLEIVFRNGATSPALAGRYLSMHPHSVFYNASSEGVSDGRTLPGEMVTYEWYLPPRAGPAPGDRDSSSKLWLYHSHQSSNTDLMVRP